MSISTALQPLHAAVLSILLIAALPTAAQAAAAILLSTATPGFALTTAEIVASTLSPDCLEYRVIGICYWLYCSRSGYRIRTSIKVRHSVPDAVVSSGENPWLEVRPMSLPNPTAKGDNDGTTNQSHENNLLKFKNADATACLSLCIQNP